MIKNIRAHSQKHRCFGAILHQAAPQLREADSRPVGLLLGSLQFAGGCYLFVPFTRFLPPFSKLCEVLPSWVWAIYFTMSGLAAVVSSLQPDGARYLPSRFLIAVWMFFNWCFLTVTSLLALLWALNGGGDVSYGFAFAFYPCLALAALWKARRVRQLLADETAEESEQENHVRELKKAAAIRDERLKAISVMPKP